MNDRSRSRKYLRAQWGGNPRLWLSGPPDGVTQAKDMAFSSPRAHEGSFFSLLLGVRCFCRKQAGELLMCLATLAMATATLRQLLYLARQDVPASDRKIRLNELKLKTGASSRR